jgi:hypothetical protein
VCTKSSIVRCGLSGACIILARAVGVCIIMVRVVCALFTESREILLVRAQCGYLLSCDILVHGAHRVLVRRGGVLKFGMVQCVE